MATTDELDADLEKLSSVLRSELRRQIQQLLKDQRRREALVSRVLMDVENALSQQLREEAMAELQKVLQLVPDMATDGHHRK